MAFSSEKETCCRSSRVFVISLAFVTALITSVIVFFILFVFYCGISFGRIDTKAFTELASLLITVLSFLLATTFGLVGLNIYLDTSSLHKKKEYIESIHEKLQGIENEIDHSRESLNTTKLQFVESLLDNSNTDVNRTRRFANFLQKTLKKYLDLSDADVLDLRKITEEGIDDLFELAIGNPELPADIRRRHIWEAFSNPSEDRIEKLLAASGKETETPEMQKFFAAAATNMQDELSKQKTRRSSKEKSGKKRTAAKKKLVRKKRTVRKNS